MKLVIKSSESLRDFLSNHGESLRVVSNPKEGKNGHRFFQCGDGTYGAVADKLQKEDIDFTQLGDYQICHCQKEDEPNGTVVPFLCKVSTANVVGEFHL